MPSERWTIEHPFVRVSYANLDEAREAFTQYDAIPGRTDRRLYYCSFDYRGEQIQLYFIARHRMEAFEILCMTHFNVHIQALQSLDGGDPRPRLEYEISMLHVHIEESKSFLYMMDDVPSEDARYQELRKMVATKLEKQEKVLAEKSKHLLYLKDLSAAKAKEEHRNYQQKKANSRTTPVPDSLRVFVNPERPPIIEPPSKEE